MTQPLRRQPLVEQTAAHLREGFVNGRWTGHLPGVLQLAEELVVSKHLVRGALRILEEEGSIEYSGAGKRRRILMDRNSKLGSRSLRVAVILNGSIEQLDAHNSRILLGIRESIESSGHTCIFARETLAQISDDTGRVSRVVRQTKADAWILYQASAIVIEWFVSQSIPTFALGGWYVGLPVASSASDTWPAIRSAVDLLAEHGHRRIVWVTPTFYRKPVPGPTCVKFLDRLKEHGIPASAYNLPDYDGTADGLVKLMDELLRITPPTALMFLDPGECLSSFIHLTRRGLEVPRDVSIVCMGWDPVLRYVRPRITRFDWPEKEHVRRILHWVQSVSKGKPDFRQTTFETRFSAGESIGPAKR